MLYKQWLPYLIIAVLLAVLFSRSKDVEVVKIPPKSGVFVHPTPEPIILYDTINLEGKTRYIKIKNPVNTELLNKYNKAVDSLEKQRLYKEAITMRNYTETYTDSFQTITVESKVIGSLESQRLSYVTNQQEIPIKVNKQSIKLYAGINTQFPINNPYGEYSIGASLNLVTKKKVYSVGLNNNQTIRIGIAFKIL